MHDIRKCFNLFQKIFNQNFKIENYKYAQLHKSITSNVSLDEFKADLSSISSVKNIKLSDTSDIDLLSDLNKWNFNNADSYFRVNSILERSTNNFLWQTSSDRNFTLEILFETKDILILGEFFDYGVTTAFYTLFFDKKTKKYRSGTTNNPSFDSTGVSNTGACLVN